MVVGLLAILGISSGCDGLVVSMGGKRKRDVVEVVACLR
jgi:hypothetical protein